MRKCKYRNCNKEIVEGRSDKIFCNRSCKRMEQTYRRRNLKKLEKSNRILEKTELYYQILKNRETITQNNI